MPTSSLDNLLKRKKNTKNLLCSRLSLKASDPLLSVILDKKLSPEDEKLLISVLEGASHIKINVVVLTDSNFFDNGKIKHVKYSRKNRHELLEAADMSLSFSFSDIQEMLLNGTIPVSSERKEVSNYNPNNETGNGFVYTENDHWCMFAALVRALETFKFPYDWKNIIKQGLSSVSV